MMYPVMAAVAALLPLGTLGAAIIGDGNVVLGVSDWGALGAPYVGGVAGLPASDPINFADLLRLRGPGGDDFFFQPLGFLLTKRYMLMRSYS